MVYFITRDVAVVTDLWCLAQVLGSVAPRMGVAEPLRRPTASRGRKRPRAAARLVGTSRAACCRSRLRVNPFLVWFVFLWLLFSGVWETLIFGTGDWFAFGEPFFCGLFTPTYPLPGHRLVPESHKWQVFGMLGRHERDSGPLKKATRRLFEWSTMFRFAGLLRRGRPRNPLQDMLQDFLLSVFGELPAEHAGLLASMKKGLLFVGWYRNRSDLAAAASGMVSWSRLDSESEVKIERPPK